RRIRGGGAERDGRSEASRALRHPEARWRRRGARSHRDDPEGAGLVGESHRQVPVMNAIDAVALNPPPVEVRLWEGQVPMSASNAPPERVESGSDTYRRIT